MRLKAILFGMSLLIVTPCMSDSRIVPKDYLGNQLPGQQYEIRGNKIVPTDYLGNRVPGTQYEIKGDKVQHMDYLGNRLPNKPLLNIKK